MFNGIKQKLRFLFYTKIKKMTGNEYSIMRN